MTVIIGVDPHKASHTAVAISDGEEELDRKKVRSGGAQLSQLVSWAEPFEKRTWAIESASGLGYLLAQQLVAAGETVVDVPATLASRARVLATGRSNKNDPNDALSVAVAALRSPDLRRVEAVGHSEVLRLLAKRNIDIGNQRSRVVSRMHSLLAELAGGGIAKEINASDVDRFLEAMTPSTSGRAGPLRPGRRAPRRHPPSRRPTQGVTQTDPRRRPRVRNVAHRPVRCRADPSRRSLIGYTGDATRFRNRDHYAAYNGTAPVEFSSAGRTVHRLSQRGNRRLNHAIHMVAICQLRQPHSEGRAYFDRRVAEGKTKKEALRALKRHVSNAVYRQLVADAQRTRS